MFESFVYIRNEWEMTPLERIQKSIRELNLKLFDERIELAGITDQTEFRSKSEEIEKLERTLHILERESADCQLTVEFLTSRRENYLHEITCIRNRAGCQRRFEKLFRRIRKIDIELGPFRWSSQSFRLQ